jgi:hypothetical protein
LIAAHLQTCSACAAAATEYREMRKLIEGFAAPAFGDDVYAEIRKSVWQQIETESQAPAFFEAVAGWFQPRIILTAVAALLITVSVVGVYLLTEKQAVGPVIANVPAPVLPPDHKPGASVGSAVPKPKTADTGQRQADVSKGQRKPDRRVAPDRGNALMAYSPDAQATTMQKKTGALALQSADNLDLAPRGSEKTLRMEIQTRNPNIRIIWFAQPD